MILLDGRLVAKKTWDTLAKRVGALRYTPTLAVILVGDDVASRSYVGAKTRACKAVGILSKDVLLSGDTTEKELRSHIHTLNTDPEVDGILVQLPLPSHIRSEEILTAVHPLKDVDGFHPENLGCLLRGMKGTLPCTPKGILKLLDHYHISLEGKELVIVNRSVIVGKTLALMALQKHPQRNATVTVCHSKTKDIFSHCRRADVLVTALGQAECIGSNEIKEGAVIIDVSINRSYKNGKYCLTGDVDRESVEGKAAYLSPVPGGVGPMTIAMLLENTVEAANKRRHPA